jgi:UDP-N-acetylmuramate-alanine ligase
MPAGRVFSSEGARAGDLIAAMSHPDARALPVEDAVAAIAQEAQPGDVIVVMGAGDIWMVERPLLDALQARLAQDMALS